MYRILFFLNINLLLLSGCARNDLSPVDIKIDSDVNIGAAYEPNIDQQFSRSVVPNEYKVHEGETIFTIASKLDLDPMNLAAINKLSPPYKVYKGQIIKIPEVSGDNFNQSGIKEIELPQAENSPKAESMQSKQGIDGYEESGRKTEVSGKKKESLEKLDGELKDFLSSSDKKQSAQQNKEDGDAVSSLNAQQAELLKAPKITKPVINKKTKEQDKKPLDIGSNVSSKLNDKNVKPSTANATKYEAPISGKIISNYGENLDGMPNDGINIKAPLGTKVKSINDGEVIYVGDKIEGHGNIVVVKHKNAVISTYAHLNDVAVKKGANVKAGQIIGSVGKTGDVTTPQLHLEIMKNKQPVNPTKYINIRS